MAERITYTTVDRVKIVGDWSPAPTVLGAVILFHMLPETRSSWAALQQELSKRSIASLAIDLRGHGQSTEADGGAKLNYQQFTDEDNLGYSYDVSGAIDWVKSRSLEPEHIALGGASIGANLAFQGLTTDPKIAGAFLLSPAAEYQGVKAFDAVPNLAVHQALFVASSEEDTQSFADSRKIVDLAPVENKTFVPYRNAGHGMALLTTDRTLILKLADWVADIIRG